MSRPALLLIFLTSLGFSTPASADQCAWVEPAVAEKAAKELTAGRRVVELCEPCRETRPRAKRTLAADAAIRPVARHPEYREVTIAGEAHDLAYLFVERKPGVFENVALIAGCPAVRVSRQLRLR